MSSYAHIELRLRYPGYPRIAVIDGLTYQQTLNRVWCADYLLFARRERTGDGRQEQVYELPLIDAVYEVWETHNGRRVQRYVATRNGDPMLYTLRRTQVEAIAGDLSTINTEIGKCVSRVPCDLDGAIRKENTYV